MKYLLLLGLVVLIGCGSQDATPEVKPIIIKNKPLTRPALNLPSVDRYTPRDIDWVIITPDNANEIFDKLAASGRPTVIIGVDEKGYENIALNTKESLKLILQQQAVIDGYKQYYININSNIDEHNASLNQ